MPGAVCREDVCRTSRAVNKTEAIGERASILREQRMKSLLEKYMFRSPSSAPPNGQARSVQTVILTGTTGSLGNYVLAALESMPRSAVNFNLALDSFEPQIRGVWNLLDFGAQSAHQAPLVDWIPVDTRASIILELVQNSLHGNGKQCEGVQSAVHFQKLAEIETTVDLKDWVRILEESSHEKKGAIVERNPAMKLLDFMRGLSLKEMPLSARSMYEVKALTRDSQQAAEFTGVTAEWPGLWIHQWRL
ncbi:hypothetical protein L207DRAFT_612220 [Hyaloscypha variabilis F]|uniref:Thioester reductase (TE) domain-containing protein n=1 Tax=Hyaloscypha variabilis (strain UAMH 11265 / GT02V1 / F) TaxID=1149755 RepID=A0A2J6QX89_HYAVF|nr:hypothetical protein L207DRAFT_612220 [Hyaloscypha variabilis F]